MRGRTADLLPSRTRTAGPGRLGRVGLAVVLVATVLAVVGMGPRRADAQSEANGLSETSVNTFLFDAERGVVRVTIDITLTNVTTDQRVGDQIRQSYFDEYYAVVPLGAENIVATRNGQVLDGELITDPESPAFATYEFALGRRVFSGQSTSLQVTYDHLGAEPRNEVPWRVNEAYASFLAYGFGDPGQVTVRVVRPAGYEFDDATELGGFTASEPDGFGSVVYERTELDEDFGALVSMSNDDRLVRTEATAGGADLVVAAWPDDPEWTPFVLDGTDVGIPALEETLGTEWPLDEVTIRQTIAPSFLGYAGFFDGSANEIALGEEFDHVTLYHELAHAWIDGAFFSERWLIEGFAQVVAADVAAELDGIESEPDLTELDVAESRRLHSWEWWLGGFEAELYGYDASWFVVDTIVDDLGPEATMELYDTIFEDRRTYLGSDPDETGPPGRNDWRRFVDVVEHVGGDTTLVEELLDEYVLPARYRTELERRTDARADYDRLTEAIAPWAMPAVVRDPMERWSLGPAEHRLGQLEELLPRIEGLRADADDLGVALDLDPLRREFEALANSFAPVTDTVGSLEDDADALVTALDELDRRTTEAGIDAIEPYEANSFTTFADAGDAVRAELDRADEFDRRWSDAVGRLAELGVAEPPVSSPDGPIAGFAAALELVDRLDAVVDRLADVRDAVSSSRTPIESVGLIGSDPAGDLDAAERSVERADLAAAESQLDQIDERLDGASSAGWTRLAIAGAVVALLALAVVLLVRRRRRGAHDAGPAVEPGLVVDERPDGPHDVVDDDGSDAGVAAVSPPHEPVGIVTGTVDADGRGGPPRSDDR